MKPKCLSAYLCFVNQSGANASELVSSSSAYESLVTTKTLVQSETIGKTKILVILV